jgi:hypothetical protein
MMDKVSYSPTISPITRLACTHALSYLIFSQAFGDDAGTSSADITRKAKIDREIGEPLFPFSLDL